MKVSLRIDGASALAKHLTTLPQAMSRKVQVAALVKGAEPIRADAARFAPRDERANGPHLADNIVIGVVSQAQLEKRDRFDEVVVEVGPALRPSDHFYGFFQEYGTKFHRAQPFMRPAFDGSAGTSLQRVLSSLWQDLKKAALKMFREQARSAGSSRAKSSGVGL